MDQTFVTRLNTIKALNSKNVSFVNKDLYRLVSSQPVLLDSYKKTKRNKRFTALLNDQDLVHQFGGNRLEILQQSLLNESWQPKPTKEGSDAEEEIVQLAVVSVLEAIYEPVFCVQSFGYRPDKNQHSALKDIESKYDGLSYAIKGEIDKIHDNLDHHTLVGLLAKKIEDSRFISLIWKLLKVKGRPDKLLQASFNNTTSKRGLSERSVLSPILINIHLHELDMVMIQFESLKTSRSKKLTTVGRECKNQIKRLTNKAKKLDNGPERDETIKQLKATKLKNIKSRTYVDPHNRVYYHRYGTDFIIGVAGPERYALEIQEVARAKLKQLSLTLNNDQTQVVFLRKKKIRFLGYDIHIDTSKKITKVHSKGKTPFLKASTGWLVLLEAPMQHIIEKLSEKSFCDKTGYPTPKKGWSSMSDYQIIDLYNITFGGILAYYSGACHRNALGRLLYIFRYSCAMTLATKHRLTIHKIFKKHGKQLEIVYGNKGDKRIRFYEPKTFKEKDKNWTTKKRLPDPFRTIHGRRTKTNMFTKCFSCGKDDNVEMHHVRHVRKAKGNHFNQQAGIIERKQIALCVSCHNKVHAGKYDGKKVSTLVE